MPAYTRRRPPEIQSPGSPRNPVRFTDSNGVDYWENLMFSQIRDAEIQLGVDVYKG
jgi:hypothetical protein